MIENFEEEKFDLLKKTLKELCLIPAPSWYEDDRAKYCMEFVKARGFKDAYIDNAKNVIWSIKGKSDKIVLFTAHTDTVFPDREPMPFIEDETCFRCPGVGDDTGALVPMMIASCSLLKENVTPEYTLVFSANSGEEGLGNLKGIRELCKNFGDKMDRMYSFDGRVNHIFNKVVGSKRFNVTVETEGGHSFSEFGKANANAVLAEIINKIYAIKVPKVEGEKVTYNVGTIEGGTSVNTISQKASMLCEYRATNVKLMAQMENEFKKIFEDKYDGATVKVELVGDRPCSNGVDEKIIDEMTKTAIAIQSKYAKGVFAKAASTDCNIPLSMGIPAICMGAYEGEGEHTREEWITKEGLKKGYCICLETMEIEAARK